MPQNPLQLLTTEHLHFSWGYVWPLTQHFPRPTLHRGVATRPSYGQQSAGSNEAQRQKGMLSRAQRQNEGTAILGSTKPWGC